MIVINKKPRLLLDCDGVLSDFIGGALHAIHAVTARRHTHAEVDQWDYEAALKLTPLEREQHRALILERGFCMSLAVLGDARAQVRELRKIVDVYVVTAPYRGHPTWAAERAEWLDKHFDFDARHIVSTEAKHAIAGRFLVDDKVSTLHRWLAHHPTSHAICWRTPHNKKEAHSPSVSNWQELRLFIESSL